MDTKEWKSKGKLELKQLNSNWIAHAISYPIQAMFKVNQRLLKVQWLKEKDMFDSSIDKCMSNS